MFRLYDKGYKIGFIANLCFFTVVNIVEYVRASQEFAKPVFQTFAPAPRFPYWGFPFDWNRSYFGRFEDGPIPNFIAIVVSGFIVGVIFRFFRSKYLDFKHK